MVYELVSREKKQGRGYSVIVTGNIDLKHFGIGKDDHCFYQNVEFLIPNLKCKFSHDALPR